MSNLCVLSRDNDNWWNYDRCFHKEERLLSQDIASAYNQKQAVITTSGNNALYYITNALTNRWTHIFYGDELYCDTPRQLKDLLSNRMVKSLNEFSVLLSIESIAEMIDEKMKSSDPRDDVVVIIESCTNPSGHMIDFEKIQQLKQKFPNLLIVVDNTWLSSVSFNPFDFGADIVYESLSKYNSNGTRIGGVIVFKNDELANKVMYKIKISGLHIEVDVCQHFRQMFQGLRQRVLTSSASTQRVAKTIAKHTKAIDVIYPGLEKHVHHERVKKLTNGIFPSVFLIQFMARSKNQITNLLNDCGLWCATSYGGTKSRVDPYFRAPKQKIATLRLALGTTDEKQFELAMIQFLNKI